MAASFVLTLDTRAPQVTFGTPTWEAGLLRVPYTSNEPGIVAARASSADGTAREGDVGAHEITFPYDIWTHGSVYVDVEDEVGNSATRTLIIPNPVNITTREYTLSGSAFQEGGGPRWFTGIGINRRQILGGDEHS